MKGMMGFLQKAGFIQPVEPEADRAAAAELAALAQSLPPPAPVAPVEQTLTLKIEDVYAAAGVPPSSYPAEKMLRLMDGLKTMDEATRRQAVQAMDAADDSWSIEDPIRDAIAKIQALSDHCDTLRAGVEQAQAQTQAQIAQVNEAEAGNVADIRRQITELESLLQRQLSAAAEEKAQLQAAMQIKRESASRSIEHLSLAASDLRRLVAQFGSPAQPAGTIAPTATAA